MEESAGQRERALNVQKLQLERVPVPQLSLITTGLRTWQASYIGVVTSQGRLLRRLPER